METINEELCVESCNTCGTCITSDSNNTPLKVWVLKFEVTGIGKGTAVIKEASPIAAENKLRHDGVFNSAPYLYKVTDIEEVIEPPCAELMAEEIVTMVDVVEGPYTA